MTRAYKPRPWATLTKGKSFRVAYPPNNLIRHANSVHAPKVFASRKTATGFTITRTK